jgi:hypothetical protein
MFWTLAAIAGGFWLFSGSSNPTDWKQDLLLRTFAPDQIVVDSGPLADASRIAGSQNDIPSRWVYALVQEGYDPDKAAKALKQLFNAHASPDLAQATPDELGTFRNNLMYWARSLLSGNGGPNGIA